MTTTVSNGLQTYAGYGLAALSSGVAVIVAGIDSLNLTPGQRLLVLSGGAIVATFATLATGKNRSDQAVAQTRAAGEIEAARATGPGTVVATTGAGDIQTPDAPPAGDDSLLTVPGGSPVTTVDPGE